MDPAEHYCIDPLGRVNLADILALIARNKYSVRHTPRQTGKTSVLLALQGRLNSEANYRCVYVTVEVCREAGEDTARATRTLLADLASRSFEVLRDDFVESTMSEHLEKYDPGAALGQTLVRWSATSQVPLVLLRMRGRPAH